MSRHLLVPLLLLAMGMDSLRAGEAAAPSPGARMDYGTVVAYGVSGLGAKGDLVRKGIAIRVGPDAAMCFDTETLRWAGGWRGDFINMSVTNAARTAQGKATAPIVGTPAFITSDGPGWSDAAGHFTDPRPDRRGDLPRSWGHYGGLHRHGDQVVVSYLIGDTPVREVPGVMTIGRDLAFTRTIDIAAGPARRLLIAEVAKAAGYVTGPGSADHTTRLPASGATAVLDASDVGGALITAAAVIQAPDGAFLETKPGRIELALPVRAAASTFTIALWSGDAAGLGETARVLATAPVADVAAFSRPGPSRWPVVSTAGVRGKDDAAYAIDTITLPTGVPGNPWIRPSGIDFLDDGSAVLCTFGGEVWVVSGLTGDLASVRWKRFASGLYEPLGLVAADGAVYVTGRDRITRLRDLNHDGEADAYNNFHSLGDLFDDYHDFVFDLARDDNGDFYLARGGNRVPWDLADHSALLRIAKDGSSRTVVATGFRAPNGLAVGPQGQLTVSDNQGHWTPASKINLIKPGGAYGYVADPRVKGNEQVKAPERFDPPLCWIPMAVDNSSASQVWVPDDRWGPLVGSLLHLSYGKSTLLIVPHGSVDGVAQGGVVTLPLKFASGIMRARFNPADGQLYVCGLKGWQTNAGLDGCFQRVRWTGKPIAVPLRMQVLKDAIAVEFSAPLAADTVNADSVTAQRWNYQWSATYGSPDVKPDGTPGRETVEVTKVALSSDGRTATFTIPGLAPVMQLALKYRFESASGDVLTQELSATITVVPP